LEDVQASLGSKSWVFNPHPTKRESSTANPPSWIALHAAPTKLLILIFQVKIPNGSTAHPCALRALTIIPDGFTVFLLEYFGNSEG
jgi:hypothetical protein